MNYFCPFEQFHNQPIANYNDKFYNLPFNMHTFNQIYGIKTIDELNKNIDY
jgi:UDP-galactopyranose mutase